MATRKRIDTVCPYCFTWYRVKPDDIGELAECVKCFEDFIIIKFLGIKDLSFSKLFLPFLQPFIRKCPGCGSKNNSRILADCCDDYLTYHLCGDCRSFWAEESVSKWNP